MDEDIFKEAAYGKAAYRKMEAGLGPIPENFRFYEAESVGSQGVQSFRLKGAQFRQATKGKNKGRWNQIVSGSEVEIFVSKEEAEKERSE